LRLEELFVASVMMLTVTVQLEVAAPALNKALTQIVARLTARLVKSIEALPTGEREKRFSISSEPMSRIAAELKYAIKENHSFFFQSSVRQYEGENLESRPLATEKTKAAMLRAQVQRPFQSLVIKTG